MQTPAADITADQKEYRRIVQGFRLLKLPKGECRNG
jgi:hypothetical protein